MRPQVGDIIDCPWGTFRVTATEFEVHPAFPDAVAEAVMVEDGDTAIAWSVVRRLDKTVHLCSGTHINVEGYGFVRIVAESVAGRGLATRRIARQDPALVQKDGETINKERHMAKEAGSIEALTAAIGALTAALEANTEALDASGGEVEEKTTTAKKTTAKKTGKAKGPTIDDVRTALREFSKLEGKDAAKEKLLEVGEVESVAELDEAKYQDVIDALNE